jgi:septal ring factor EnvC (AmiA/AmiB activator)
MSQLTETEESLVGFIKKVSEYSTVFDSMQVELKNLKPQNLTSTENDISKTSESENDERQKSKTILSEIGEIDSEIPKLISKIEGKLQIFSSTRYTISKS